MKIWSPVKVFRSLMRFLVCEKALRTEFNINILDIFVFELEFRNSICQNFSKQANIEDFLPWNLCFQQGIRY